MATFIYRHPKRDRKSGSRKSLAVALFLAVLVGLYLVAVTVAPLLAMSGQTSAGTGEGPKTVWGFVYDGMGSGIEDVLVTVTVEIPADGIRATLTYTTDPGGFYTVTFAESQWSLGDTIVVSAELDGEVAENSAVIAEPGNERIDLHFILVIPELHVGMTVAATVSLLVMITLLVRRRQGRGV